MEETDAKLAAEAVGGLSGRSRYEEAAEGAMETEESLEDLKNR